MKSHVQNYLNAPYFIFLDLKLVQGDGLDLILEGMPFQIYPLASNLALKFPIPILLERYGKAGEDSRLGL
jgi:hypothetical protein